MQPRFRTFYMHQYSRLPEDEPSDSKHAEDFKKNSKLTYKFMNFAFRFFIYTFI